MSLQQHPVSATEARFAVVDRDISYLRTPLNWRLRIYGQGVGGYAPAEGSVSRYARKADAERTAQVWMDAGVYPAQQGPATPNARKDVGDV